MKKSTIAKMLMCIMFPSVLMFGGCVGGDNGGGLDSNPQLKDMVENTQNDPDYYKRFTYTYYDSNGNKLSTSAFSEAYVFVDPGKDGVYHDHKTGASVGFAELAMRELSTLSKDIAYKLMSVYGEETTVNDTQEISEDIKIIETGETITSQYKVKNSKSDSLGIFEDSDKAIYNTNYTNGVYRLDDMFTLSLLSINSGSEMADDTNFEYFEEMFGLKNAISGGGFNVVFDITSPNWFDTSDTLNSDRQWVVKNNGINTVDALATYIYDKLLSIKTGGSNDIYSIDHLGFTTSQIASIKSVILSDVIGTGNVNNDTISLQNLIENSADAVPAQGKYVSLNSTIVEGQTIFNGNSAFVNALTTYLTTKDTESNAESVLKQSVAYQSYVNMFGYKAYGVVVDKIVDLALNSSEYDAEDVLVNAEENPLYFLYPRVSVMIVPGEYLGGENTAEEDDLGDDEDYDFDEIADQSGYDENFEPSTTMEPYLPSWKIISIVYKPDAVYGINNVTEERIDGVIVSDLDLAFVGEEGYSSVIESRVSYVSNGTQIVSGDDARVQDILIDDICPDMSASNYPDNHYLTLFDMTKMEKEQLLSCVLGTYNGFDFIQEAENASSGLSIYRVGTTDSTVYFNRVDGLPYKKSFMKYNEDSEGNLTLDMSSCLGSNYVKIDVNFLQIEDSLGNDVLNVVKRTNLGIISIEPHTAG